MWTQKWPQNEDEHKNKYDLKDEDDLKNEGELKNEDDLKKKWPHYLKFVLMTSHPTATGQLILNRKCYQVSELDIVLHMIHIIFVALPIHG